MHCLVVKNRWLDLPKGSTLSMVIGQGHPLLLSDNY